MTKKEAKENFGRWVRSEARFERLCLAPHYDRKEWIKIEEFSVAGILIGVRTYQNGIISRDDYGIYFEPNEYISIALIVPSWRSNPIPVPLDSCYLID